MERYENFLKESREEEFARILLGSEINIYVYVIIDALKKQFSLSSWYLYHSQNSLTLKYYSAGDDSYKNILKIKKFLYEKLPYFRDLECYDDDKRLVLKFVDPGSPVKFKFHY
jgi:hypothetical protein